MKAVFFREEAEALPKSRELLNRVLCSSSFFCEALACSPTCLKQICAKRQEACISEGQENGCAFWEQAASQLGILPALSWVSCIPMGWQFKLPRSETGLLILKELGEYSRMNV